MDDLLLSLGLPLRAASIVTSCASADVPQLHVYSCIQIIKKMHPLFDKLVLHFVDAKRFILFRILFGILEYDPDAIVLLSHSAQVHIAKYVFKMSLESSSSMGIVISTSLSCRLFSIIISSAPSSLRLPSIVVTQVNQSCNQFLIPPKSRFPQYDTVWFRYHKRRSDCRMCSSCHVAIIHKCATISIRAG